MSWLTHVFFHSLYSKYIQTNFTKKQNRSKKCFIARPILCSIYSWTRQFSNSSEWFHIVAFVLANLCRWVQTRARLHRRERQNFRERPDSSALISLLYLEFLHLERRYSERRWSIWISLFDRLLLLMSVMVMHSLRSAKVLNYRQWWCLDEKQTIQFSFVSDIDKFFIWLYHSRNIQNSVDHSLSQQMQLVMNERWSNKSHRKVDRLTEEKKIVLFMVILTGFEPFSREFLPDIISSYQWTISLHVSNYNPPGKVNERSFDWLERWRLL